MIKLFYTLLLLTSLTLAVTQVKAAETNINEKKITSVNLKYITGDDVVSVLKSLIDESVSISEENNVLLINGSAEKTKNILPIISQIDTLPSALTIEFIASNRKINFKQPGDTYQSGKNRSNTSQSMSITERQWVTLKTGLSIPIAERKHYADGTETQSFRYKKVSKSYVFKVHEFSGWSVIQMGVDSSELQGGPVGPIEHTQLNTTIVGKTGEWLEVASTNKINPDSNDNVYSTDRPDKKYIHLYVKVKKVEPEIDNIIKDNTETTQ